MTARIPITLLTGYLGAGKTTLLNRLLAADHGKRLAVLVNDFGAVNIDAALIESRGEEAVGLANGCVCCSISDDLGGALDAQRSRATPPDHVVLEASGVAVTSRLAVHAGNWPGFELSGVTVAIDAETLAARVEDKYVGRLVCDQIRQANLGILAKTDLAPDSGNAARSLIARLAPGLDVIASAAPECPECIFAVPAPESETGAVGGGSQAGPEGCVSTVWTPPGPVSVESLAAALDRLPESVHRVKGFVVEAASGSALLVQKVGRRASITPVDGKIAPGLVLIAVGGDPRDLNADALDAAVRDNRKNML